MSVTSVPRLTLFAAPKGFTGPNERIQRNALANWKFLGLRVILFGTDPGIAEAAREFDFTHIPDIACTEHGTPRLDHMFHMAQAVADTRYVCYINADILLPPSLETAVDLAGRKWDRFLLLGRRWDVDIDETLVFSADWPERLERIRRERASLHGPWGIDYFAFPRGLIRDMLPFAIGRPGWDGWLIWTTAQKGIALVNATDFVPILHQNHDYAHVPGAVTNSWAGSPEADRNLALRDAHSPDLDIWRCTVFRAPWCLGPSGPVRDLSPARLRWQAALLKRAARNRYIPTKRTVYRIPYRLLRLIIGQTLYERLRVWFEERASKRLARRASS